MLSVPFPRARRNGSTAQAWLLGLCGYTTDLLNTAGKTEPATAIIQVALPSTIGDFQAKQICAGPYQMLGRPPKLNLEYDI